MTTLCPQFIPRFQAQLHEPVSGRFDCTAYASAAAIAHATCGAKTPTGRTVRLQSSEPIPDPTSPGLNLVQVAAVAHDHYGVYLDVHTGLRAVTWAEYDQRRADGQGAVIQVSYAPIAASKYDAGRGFKGGHAIYEDQLVTMDSLADGRAAGVFLYNRTLYPRALMREAAGKLVINQRGNTVGDGKVWAAFTRDVVPSYRVRIPAGPVNVYTVESNRVTSRRLTTTGGFGASCTAPRSYPYPARGKTVSLVKVTGGGHAGWWVSSRWATEA